MAHCIFLKSLRFLEEFGKITASKTILNLLVQISKLLAKFQKSYFIPKDFPPNLLAQSAQPARGDARSSSMSPVEHRNLLPRTAAHLHSMVNQPTVDPAFNAPP
jgi:hypothetical protein